MDILPLSAGPFSVLLEGKSLAEFDVLSTKIGFHYSAWERRFPLTVTMMLPSDTFFAFLLHRVAIGSFFDSPTLFLQFVNLFGQPALTKVWVISRLQYS